MCVCVCASVDSVGMEEQEKERRRLVVEKFQKAPFEEIAAHCGARVTNTNSFFCFVFTTTCLCNPTELSCCGWLVNVSSCL